jgi:release factor glutamine methyltransferase
VSKDKLLAAISDTPELDLRILRACAGDDVARFEHFLARRLAHEPVAYIIGVRDFWTIALEVGPAVLIPRPDTETLLDAAVAHFGTTGPKRILDLGTGSGALLLAALDQWPQATGLGVDASEAALAVARANGARIAGERAAFRLGDWTQGIEDRFDLILCNPPYVEDDADLSPDVRDHEPHSALFAGAEGLDAYRALIPQLAAVLAPDGIICLEIGWTQRAAVTQLAEAEGFAVACRADLGGRDRCLILSNI